MKGSLTKELPVDNACKVLNCKAVETKKVKVPYLEAERNIVIFQKMAETDKKYPRQTGKPTKNPL
jgi:16S rRNA (guanine527-N7)-methyltransferase